MSCERYARYWGYGFAAAGAGAAGAADGADAMAGAGAAVGIGGGADEVDAAGEGVTGTGASPNGTLQALGRMMAWITGGGTLESADGVTMSARRSLSLSTRPPQTSTMPSTLGRPSHCSCRALLTSSIVVSGPAGIWTGAASCGYGRSGCVVMRSGSDTVAIAGAERDEERNSTLSLPPTARMDSKRASRVGPDRLVLAGAISLALLAPFLSTAFNTAVRSLSPPSSLQKEANAVARARCSMLHLVPGPDHAFQHRTQSDRFEGARSVIIHNVTVWTGEHDGQELLHGMSILLERGLISRIAPHINEDSDSESWGSWAADATVIQGNGAFVTPGIFDMHSHLGVDSAPELVGADDTNSLKAPVLPYLRSL